MGREQGGHCELHDDDVHEIRRVGVGRKEDHDARLRLLHRRRVQGRRDHQRGGDQGQPVPLHRRALQHRSQTKRWRNLGASAAGGRRFCVSMITEKMVASRFDEGGLHALEEGRFSARTFLYNT